MKPSLPTFAIQLWGTTCSQVARTGNNISFTHYCSPSGTAQWTHMQIAQCLGWDTQPCPQMDTAVDQSVAVLVLLVHIQSSHGYSKWQTLMDAFHFVATHANWKIALSNPRMPLQERVGHRHDAHTARLPNTPRTTSCAPRHPAPWNPIPYLH